MPYTSFPGGAYFPLTFSVGYQSKSRTVAYAAALAIEEIKKLQSVPPTDLELTTAKRGFIDRFPGLFATKAQVAGVFAQEEFSGRYAKDPGFYKKYRDRIGAVTAADVQRVAQKYLDLNKLVLLAVGNKEDILLGYPDASGGFQGAGGRTFHGIAVARSDDDEADALKFYEFASIPRLTRYWEYRRLDGKDV